MCGRNEEFELLLSAENMALPLVLQVWDYDYAASDDLIGEITVPLGDYIDPDAEVDHEAFRKWFALAAVNGDGDKQCVGEIELGFTFPKPAWARPHYQQNGDMIREAYLETYAHIQRPNGILCLVCLRNMPARRAQTVSCGACQQSDSICIDKIDRVMHQKKQGRIWRAQDVE